MASDSKQHVNAVMLAFQFLTRIPPVWLPMGKDPDWSPSGWGLSLLYYPLVGLVIGLILVLGAAVMNWALPSSLLAAVLVLVIWVWVTGALHLDGLADSADAWIGGQGDRQRTLAIMKDPTSGPVAVAAVVLLLLVKLAALEALLSGGATWALLWAPVAGRLWVQWLFLQTPYLRSDGQHSHGLGTDMARHLPGNGLWMALGLGLLAILLLAPNALWVLGVGILVALILRQWLMSRIGGFTGDGAGAGVEVIEAAVLLALLMGA